tara:strand:+ start:124 stop:420 length:297 start_codon:yes stop_codon:yes gene_type:complete
MKLNGEPNAVSVGAFVMNYHHGLLRFGVVREKTVRDHGWTYCKVDWLEDDMHKAKAAWNKKMGGRAEPLEETRVDFLKPVSPDWLRNVLYSYRRCTNE